MSTYAVVNPATGEAIKEYPGDQRRRSARARSTRADAAAHARGRRRSTVAERAALIRTVGELHTERREELAEIIVREMGKPIEQAARRGRLLRRDSTTSTPTTPRRCWPTSRSSCSTARARRSCAAAPRRAAGDHALELPLLPGGPLRRPEPGDRQHDPAQARAAVPGVRGGDRRDLPRRRLPGGRLRQHLRHQRADRVGHRRPAGPRRLADRLRARRRRGGRDRRAQPQEGRARARRLRPVHPAQHRRSRRHRRGGGRRAAGEHRPGLQRRQAVHRRRRALRRLPREVHRRS